MPYKLKLHSYIKNNQLKKLYKLEQTHGIDIYNQNISICDSPENIYSRHQYSAYLTAVHYAKIDVLKFLDTKINKIKQINLNFLTTNTGTNFVDCIINNYKYHSSNVVFDHIINNYKKGLYDYFFDTIINSAHIEKIIVKKNWMLLDHIINNHKYIINDTILSKINKIDIRIIEPRILDVIKKNNFPSLKLLINNENISDLKIAMYYYYVMKNNKKTKMHKDILDEMIHAYNEAILCGQQVTYEIDPYGIAILNDDINTVKYLEEHKCYDEYIIYGERKLDPYSLAIFNSSINAIQYFGNKSAIKYGRLLYAAILSNNVEILCMVLSKLSVDEIKRNIVGSKKHIFKWLKPDCSYEMFFMLVELVQEYEKVYNVFDIEYYLTVKEFHKTSLILYYLMDMMSNSSTQTSIQIQNLIKDAIQNVSFVTLDYFKEYLKDTKKYSLCNMFVLNHHPN